MVVESDFHVAVPVERAWAHLLDVERVVPCIPGAQLTETVDERTWKGRMNVRLGPMALLFAGTVSLRERDDAAHRMVLHGEGRDARNKGSGVMVATSTLERDGEGTRVRVTQDVTVHGAIAQFGRGVMEDVTLRLLADFGRCLQRSLAEPRPERPHRAATAG
jgi:carbon monoxide dehydrogenase subunit G